ncbi:hypothetical protein MKUB_42810 [Mycobacterium kubicae]|uniref:Secreted protein n=2 Tax=Mycobacterium kubicae TaxID=120959 RepID=A0ABQ1BT09_9MYCO|nr:hypothetical protein MKUB_42810 [Mycobacterium kubicae]
MFAMTHSHSKAKSATRFTHVALACIAMGALAAAPPARASADISLNGRYDATSLGNWAKTNESFHDEATVRSVWTITSSCRDAQECSGTVSSDQGWSAPIVMHDGLQWKVEHDVPNWETCPDGTPFTGHQTFLFVPVDNDGNVKTGAPTLAGTDKTIGPSGACRVNKWLVVDMPFRLDRIS